MNYSILVNCQAFIFADAGGRGAYNRGKRSVQELGGQRGDGVYFRENAVQVGTLAKSAGVYA